MTYALSRWNEIKAAQKKKGHVVAFNNEYDATAESTDFPIHYSYMAVLLIRIELMNIHRLPNNVGDRHPRIKRRIRILKNNLHFLMIFMHVFLQQILAFIYNFAGRRLNNP